MKKKEEFVGKYGGLQVIAERLNSLPLMKGDTAATWNKVEGIVSALVDPPPEPGTQAGKSLLSRAANDYNEKYRPIRFWRLAFWNFNRMAKENPISLHVKPVRSPKNMIEFKTDGPTTMGQFAVYSLWLYFFREGGWERLKRCPQCGRWFVDSSRNKNKKRCSPECTWDWWNWSRRKVHREEQGKKKKSYQKRQRRWECTVGEDAGFSAYRA